VSVKAQPSPALAAMYEHDQRLGIDPLAFLPVRVIGEQKPVDGGLRIPKPDWPRIEAEHLAREREARLREAAELLELEPAEEPARPTPPAPRQSRWRRSPA